MKVLFILILLMGTLATLACEIRPQVRSTHVEAQKSQTKKRTDVVFIGGFDEGDNTYYTNAKVYFQQRGFMAVEGQFSAAEIITWLNAYGSTSLFGEIHIVSHSNAWRGMALKTTANGDRISLTSLVKAQEDKEFPKLKKGIDATTKVVFHSCGLGENTALLRQLKRLFTATQAPQVYASPYFNIFGGKYASHYLAKPYYGFYPTAESPGPLALAAEFETNYPETTIDWFNALKTREENQLGGVYTYKFNVPVVWEFTFDTTAEIPLFKDKDALMDWLTENEQTASVLFELGIPIEKYRWRTAVKGTTLTIKGKTSVLCVLQPILNENDPDGYRTVTVTDRELYQIL